MSELLVQAVRGAVVGATLGAPLRGNPTFRALNFYEPIPARMAASDALDAWVVAAKHVMAGRGPAELHYTTTTHRYDLTHEGAFARSNLDYGFAPPLTGAYSNPLSGGAQALGRVPIWGLIFHGKPDDAARWAYWDASLDHAGESVRVAAAVATMVANAAPGVQFEQLLAGAAMAHGNEGRPIQAVRIAMRAGTTGGSPAQVAEELAIALGTRDPFDAVLNYGHLLLALSLGAGDTSKVLRLAAGFGGASDHVACAAGVLATLLHGAIDEEWLQPLGKEFVGGSSLREIDPPSTLKKFEDLIAKAAEPHAEGLRLQLVVVNQPDPPTEEPANEDAQPEAPVEAAPTAPQVRGLSDGTRALITSEPDAAIFPAGDASVHVQYLDPPVLIPGKAVKMVLSFSSRTGEEAVIEPELKIPAGWQVAHKLTSFRVRATEESRFPLVVQPDEAAQGRLSLVVGKHDVQLPLRAPERWYAVGPFVNHDGQGFMNTYRAEDVQRTKEVFNGRSDLPVKWEPFLTPGVVLDVEPLFKTGPGVVYLHAMVRFEHTGPLRVVAAASVGVIVKIGGKTVVHYHDSHVPTPRAIQPYVGEFVPGERTSVLVKVVRNRDPLLPLTLYFLTREGEVIRPATFEAMPE